MKNTNVTTTIKGSENLTVKERVESIYNALADKHAFILLTKVNHNQTETKLL